MKQLNVMIFSALMLGALTTQSVLADGLDSAASGGGSVDAAKKAATAGADPCAPKKTPGEWDLSANLGFNLARGNADVMLLTAGFAAIKELQSDNYFFTIQGAEGKQDGDTTQRFLRTDGAWQHLYDDRLYASLGGAWLSDDIANVDYRVFANPAVGYYFLKDDELKLSAEVGPSYVFQKEGANKDNFLAARVANRLDWKLSETAKVYQLAEVFVNTEDSEDYLVNSEVGVEASLTTKLALFVKVVDRLDNVPSAGRDKNDVIITSGLKMAL